MTGPAFHLDEPGPAEQGRPTAKVMAASEVDPVPRAIASRSSASPSRCLRLVSAVAGRSARAIASRADAAELDRHSDEVRKIRSYVFTEADGTVGTLCLYEA